MATAESARIYWHRDLPPLDSEVIAEQVVEAASRRVPGTLAHRDELWDQCYEDLMAQASARILQEAHRVGGSFAHVLNETVDSRHDPVSGEAWLHGAFVCAICRESRSPVGALKR